MTGFETIGNKWIHPKTGEVRYYINDAWKYGGLYLDFYNTGNIAIAKLDGEKISDSEGRRLSGAINKCWVTEDGKVHMTGYDLDGKYIDFSDKVIAGIKAAMEVAE
jgi:hypothetical protein